MADIISIDGKRKAARDFQTSRMLHRKRVAVRQAVQCTHCHWKCEKCGSQLRPAPQETADPYRDLRVPYRFCEFCSLDYIDYIERLQGRGDPRCYWQNDAWKESWGLWIRYQGAVSSFSKTPEFARLLAEVREAPPEE
ncbi:MAG: hypothetical protein RBR20_08075 [Desulfobacterales bacterium]|jgi:hypothetical protein|nr:hypothetical protein [Desulfobacteraceae bacterium]MDD3991244.1 hypothetical protein [Desulfobacteraceae bacterium]MDY0312071.1 hypothetical protein [Desulfobacterales bacterium]